MAPVSRRSFVGAVAGGAAVMPFMSGVAREAAVPLIFDTDIGTDIDDALTVVYLLGQERCELLGVTTAYGDTMDRARLVSAICTGAGRDIPIHPGSQELMSGRTVTGKVPQAEVLANWPHRDDFEPDSAVEFIYDTIKNRPGEVTLLAVGPLTNVARLFQRHPDAPLLLKGLTIMNGSFRILYPEYNAVLDRQATRMVYQAKVPKLTAIDLDTSLRCRMGKKEARRRIKGGAFEPVADMLEVWFRTLPLVIFYDSIAAVSIFEPGLVKLRSARVRFRMGRTIPSLSAGPHWISVGVEEKEFKEHFFRTVQGV